MTSANRVIVNTAISYCRMVLTVGVSLYSTRLILEALGSSDFGIFQLVGGVVAMLAFLKNTMATSTQRFLSFFQGKNETQNQKSVFFNSLILHIIIGVLIVLVLAACESLLFEGFLNIPDDRIYAAKIVYRTVLASLFFSMVNVPFMGSLVAHENLLFVAIVNILEALMKLTIAFVLISLSSNKLIIYGWLMAALDFVTLILYMIYCFKRYEECTVQNIRLDKTRVKELSSFAGWNLFGSLCSLGRNQGLAILLNLFFGAVINAAYGIANQLASQMNLFSVTMLRALNPQIMKSEGSNNRERMLRLSMIASKFGFFLAAIVAVPAIFEMTDILAFWLKDVPEYTVIFAQLILISLLINQMTIGLQSALQATGKIKLYQIVVGGLILLTLPVAYLFLEMGYPPYSVFISYMIFESLAVILRMLIAKKIAQLSLSEYMARVFLKSVGPVVLLIGTCYYISNYWQMDYRFIVTGSISSVIFIGSVYFFGLCEDEKLLVIKFLKVAKSKFVK